MNNENLLERYKTYQREASSILRREKRKYIHDIMKKAELGYRAHKTRNMYKKISPLSEEYKNRARFLKRSTEL